MFNRSAVIIGVTYLNILFLNLNLTTNCANIPRTTNKPPSTGTVEKEYITGVECMQGNMNRNFTSRKATSECCENHGSCKQEVVGLKRRNVCIVNSIESEQNVKQCCDGNGGIIFGANHPVPQDKDEREQKYTNRCVQ